MRIANRQCVLRTVYGGERTLRLYTLGRSDDGDVDRDISCATREVRRNHASWWFHSGTFQDWIGLPIHVCPQRRAWVAFSGSTDLLFY